MVRNNLFSCTYLCDISALEIGVPFIEETATEKTHRVLVPGKQKEH